MRSRLFRWICPCCRTVLSVETEEHEDDDSRGVDATGCFGYEVRCPMCMSQMVEEDEVAAWYSRQNPTTKGFTLNGSHFEQWRSEQSRSKHDERCEVYDREDSRCECGHDERMIKMGSNVKKTTAPAGADRDEIPVPLSLSMESRDAREMARVWVTEKGDLHAIIDSSILEDVSMWGVVLKQLGHHVADAYDPYGDLSREQVLEQIKAKLDEAWND